MGLTSIDAKELISKVSEKDLKNILKFFGEEKFASKIANKIINTRKNQNISSAKQLAEIIQAKDRDGQAPVIHKFRWIAEITKFQPYDDPTPDLLDDLPFSENDRDQLPPPPDEDEDLPF